MLPMFLKSKNASTRLDDTIDDTNNDWQNMMAGLVRFPNPTQPMAVGEPDYGWASNKAMMRSMEARLRHF